MSAATRRVAGGGNAGGGNGRDALRRRIFECYGPETQIRLLKRAPRFAATLFVADLTRGARLLRVLGSIGHGGRMAEQSGMDLMRPERLVYAYEKMMMTAFALAEGPGRRDGAGAALLLGLGGGDMLRHLAAYLADWTVTQVERDPLVIDIARRHFHLAGPVIETAAEDFVAETRERYDVILVDLYDGQGAAAVEPSFWAACAAALKSGGCVAINWADFVEAPTLRREAELIAAAIGRSCFATLRRSRENLVQLATPDARATPVELERCWRRFAARRRLPREDRDILERAVVTADFP